MAARSSVSDGHDASLSGVDGDGTAGKRESARPVVSRVGSEPTRRIVAAIGVWLVVVAVAVIWLDRLGRSRTFFYDEWPFVIDRWQFGIDTFLQPHNGHLSIVPASAYFALFHTVGLDDYRAFRLAGIVGHVLLCSAVALYAGRRLGIGAGIAAGAIVLFLGTGWQNILWPFQIGFMVSVAAFVVALLALDRHDGRGDAWATVTIAVSIASSGVGLPLAAAVLLEVLLTPVRRRRWWIAGGPLILYGVWYLAYGESQASPANIDAIPNYVSDSLAGAMAGLFGLRLDWGRLIGGVLVGILAASIAHRRGTTPRVVALVATLVGFWSLTALSRGQVGDPAASRYVYVGVVLILLLGAEALSASRRPFVVSAVVVAVAALSIWSTADVMRAGASGLRIEGELIGTELAVMELVRDSVPPDYVVDGVHAPGLTALKYFSAVDGLGSSPAYPIDVVDHVSAEARAAADRVLLELSPPTFEEAARDDDQEPNCSEVESGSVLELRGGSETSFTSRDPDAGALRLWRFADAASAEPTFTMAPRVTRKLVVPSDGSTRPWHVQTDAALVCSGD